MSRSIYAFFFFCLLFSCSSMKTNTTDLQKLLESYAKSHDNEKPAQIEKWTVDSAIYYHVFPKGADRYSELYNSDLELICHPEGGMVGTGDGKCPDWAKTVKNKEIIWTNQ